jgi:DNA-binding NarL/FixJ family response regulator
MARRTAAGDQAPSSDSLLPCDLQTWQKVAKLLALSPKQERIVELILQGKQDRQIAHQMSISVSTVRTYLTRIYGRIEVPDRVHLILRVFSMAHRHVTSAKSPQ